MILDTLQNLRMYEGVHHRFKQVCDFLQQNEPEALPLGKIKLDGDDLFINVVEITGKTESEARMETHKNYIDIQIPIGGTEFMGWTPTCKLQEVLQPYNADKDVTFYADKASNLIRVKPYEFAVFFPEDGHQPGISDSTYKKLIVKVRV